MNDTLSPRALRTREALLAAGLQLLADRPVAAVSIDELVAVARVGKGSFFNHFVDKQHFAAQVAAGIRRDVEARVELVNAGVREPLERIAGGMIAAAGFAFTDARRTAVLARAGQGMTLDEHPLNKGLRDDVDDAAARGLLREQARSAGVLFWLGCCATLMNAVIERRCDRAGTLELLRDMLTLGLGGIAADPAAIEAATRMGAVSRRFERAMASD